MVNGLTVSDQLKGSTEFSPEGKVRTKAQAFPWWTIVSFSIWKTAANGQRCWLLWLGELMKW